MKPKHGRMRNAIFLTALLLLVATAVAKGGQQFFQPQKRPMTVWVDSIDYRPSLTRVYCRALGRPNTSGRIDSVTVANTRASIQANDIDPIEFGRSFQWEEDGVLPLEIDFPPLNPQTKPVLRVHTPYGSVIAR